jgi:hypothetical protein
MAGASASGQAVRGVRPDARRAFPRYGETTGVRALRAATLGAALACALSLAGQPPDAAAASGGDAGDVAAAAYAAGAGPGAAPDAGDPWTAAAALPFARLEFDSVGGPRAPYFGRGRRERWATDFPQADENFTFRLGQLTSVRPRIGAHTVSLSDPALFDHPLLYLVDVGWMVLSPEEEDVLRSYLQRGGMLWVDDFWGDAEWANLERVMAGVLPGRPWRDVPGDHPVFHVVYELDGLPYVPASRFATPGGSGEPPWIHREPAGNLSPPALRGWFDDVGRPLVLATFNTDLGDGFERESFGQWYFETFSTRAYAMGVNIVVYALTR